MARPGASKCSILGCHFVGKIFEVYLPCFLISILNMKFACILGPWSPKTVSFCKNLLLCRFPVFFPISHQLSLRSKPFLFVRKWAHWYLWLVFFQCWQSVRRSYLPFFCPRVVVGSQSDLDKWHGVGFWYLSACNSCKKWIPYKMTTSVNTAIPCKMTGPNLAKFLSWILSLLSYCLFNVIPLTNGKGLATSLQNDHRKCGWRPSILVNWKA